MPSDEAMRRAVRVPPKPLAKKTKAKKKSNLDALMNPEQIILLVGLCSFPIYVAYREGASSGKYAAAWAAAEISLLLLFVILAFLTQETAPWLLYFYTALLLLSYWRLFELRNISHVPMPLSVIAWVLGIALVVALVFFYITLNRYAFIREGEYRTEVYDRFTGEHHY